MKAEPCLCGGCITVADEHNLTEVGQAVREHQGTVWHLGWRARNGWPRAASPRLLGFERATAARRAARA